MKLRLFILYLVLCVQKLAFAAPTANFSLSVIQGCVPLTIRFSDLSTGSPTKYEWDFGNGNKSTLKNPSAIYYASGRFTITLTVWDASGNKSVKTFNPVKVFKNPSAAFSADTVGCVGDLINLNDLSNKADTAITQWSWDYGDGQLGGAKNPGYKYSFPGRYSIGLTVTDGYGCKSSTIKTNYIRIKPSPVLDFTIDKTYSCSLPAKFVVLNKSTGATSYNWTCSNGSAATSKDFFITINSYGSYSVTLSASNNGCSATLTKNTIKVSPLKPDFKMPTGPFCEGSEISFTNTSTPNDNSMIYSWDFGDGETSTEVSPKHTYGKEGNYIITLTMEGDGCSEKTTKTITINPIPKVSISVLDSIGCNPPFKATFNIWGTGYVSSQWNYGDQTAIKNIAYPNIIEHYYAKKGNFNVTAKISNSFGCNNILNLKEKIRVNTQSVEIDPSDLEGCIPYFQKYTLKENLAEGVKSYEWTFSDSTAKYNTNFVNKTFYKEGYWYAYVKVITTGGCILMDTAKIAVGRKFEPNFKLLNKHICNKDTVFFKNLTPDSIKRKKEIYFNLMPVDSSAFTSKITDTSYLLETKKGGKYLMKLNIKHYGCNNDSKFSDTIYVHGPYLSLTYKWLDCKNTIAKFKKSHSWSNRDSLYFNSKLLNEPDSFLYYRDIKQDTFKYMAWNDTFNCKDSVIVKPKPTSFIDLGGKQSISSSCTPSNIKLEHNGVLKNSQWLFPDGTTDKKLKTTYKATTPGLVKILLVGTYPPNLCPDTLTVDTNYFLVPLDGAPLKSKLIANGKCMPIQLSLYDSTAGKDANQHVWMIGNETITTKELETKYTINSIPLGSDTAIEVKHIITSTTGCVSEKKYFVPFAGPKIAYELKQFYSCDTPMYYFQTKITDSSSTRFPLTYSWNFSDGAKKTGWKISGRFNTIGMNYFTLRVKDGLGCDAQFYDSFEVSPNMLQPLFFSNPTGRFCPPLKCSFTDLSKTFNSEIVSWEWDFGDGTGSRLQFPEKLYLVPGKFDITLKIRSRSGCVATLKKPGYIIVNGPRGFYDFDRGNACLPHTVEFRGKALDSATMEWDFGDGVVVEGNNLKHIYNRRGRYIPAMILSDTLGCKYALPPIDTIEVFDYPQAKLSVNGLCFNEALKVKNSSISNHEDSEVKTLWYYNQKLKNPVSDSIYKPEKRGWNEIKLIVENKGTCKDTVLTNIRLFAPIANFSPSDPLICLGIPLLFKNQSSSDTFIKRNDWLFGDKATSSVANPSHIYNRPGQYDVDLIVTDVLNCSDTMHKPAIANVGDTASPPLVPIRRANVMSNNTVELVMSKFPTFDFKKYIIFKEVNGKYLKTAEHTNVNDTVFFDRFCNTLDRSYCYKIATQNLCLKQSNELATPEHCTIETKANGEFELNKVVWTPYIGFDSILHYEIWRQEYNSSEQYKYLGKVPPDVLEFKDTLITCYTRQNYRIVAQQKNGFKEYSRSDTATAKPFTINTTLPNYAWRATVEDNDYARIEWLNNAWSRNGMKAYLLTKSVADGRVMFKDKYFDLLDTVYNDLNTNVQSNSYIYTVKGIDNCNDTTPTSNMAQTILLKGYFDEASQKPAIHWNHYQKWSQGINYYEIEQKQLDGSFIWIGKVSANDTSFIDKNATTNCNPQYVYRVRAVSYVNSILNKTTTSLSNEANVFPFSTLFIPNAFSPNSNAINETYGPNGQYIHKYHFEIFNRWGEKLFETTNCMEQWDGKFKGEICEQEVYLYHLSAMGADNKKYNIKGTFHLLR